MNTCTIIKVQGNDENRFNCFTVDDLNKIKEYKLDVLLHTGVHKIDTEIGKIAKHGIWSLLHSKNYTDRSGCMGLVELLDKVPAIEVVLHRNKEGSVDHVIDKAFFSPHWSLIKTKDEILEGSVSLLLKNLRILSEGNYVGGKVQENSISLSTVLNLNDVLKYSISFYLAITEKIFKGLNSKLFGANYQRWNLFLGKGDFLNTELSQLKPARPPKDEFWADPFLFHHENKCHVFFETYCYKTKKGKLSCGSIQKGEITNIVDILDLDYHLSYPFIFEEEGEIYLMPETLDNKRLEIYKCLHFPTKWELFTTAFDGEMVADASFYNDKEGQKWLFVNKKEIKNLPLNSELFIYKVDSVKLNTLVPHSQNPVIIDSRIGRNGGAIFNYGDEIFRPSQRNEGSVYGRALNINRIKELTINSYVEENSLIIEPDFHKGLISMHHLHQIDDLFVFDAAFKK
ncbi:hypothetical protein OO009_10885 [Flavobacteriaceae bacterium KMM 6897]|nr:hypothetical protein [Flavobacteriaceae bacterium KMM 6897]